MESAWHPDPTGRHQYRWWDGARWTEHASDNGTAVIDPLDAPAAVVPTPVVPTPVVPTPVVPTPVVPTSFPSPLGAPSPVSPASAPPKRRRTGLIVGGVAAAVLVVGGGAALLAGRGDGGADVSLGEHDESLASDSGYVAYRLRLERGDAVRFRVEPGTDLDAVVSIVADTATAESDAEFIADNLSTLFDNQVGSADDVLDELFTPGDEVFTRGEAEDEFGDHYVLQTMDNDYEGALETDYYVSFGDGDYWLVVTSADGTSSDDFRLIVEQSDEQWVLDEDTTLDDISDYQEQDFFTDEGFYEDPEPYELVE